MKQGTEKEWAFKYQKIHSLQDKIHPVPVLNSAKGIIQVEWSVTTFRAKQL